MLRVLSTNVDGCMECKTVTRAELHALVWARPLRAIAKDLGVSDVGLSKICKRHGVPTPPQGHWTLVHLGKPVTTIALPPTEGGQTDQIEISSWVSRLPARATEEIACLESELRDARVAPDAKSEDAGASKGPFAKVEQPHKAVRVTASKLRRAKADRDGVVRADDDNMCGIEARSEDAERLISFLDALVAALEARDIAFTPLGRSMKVERGPDEAKFAIRPKRTRQAFVATEAEIAAEQKRLVRAERDRKTLGYVSWSNNQPVYPEFHQVLTGHYALGIEGWGSGLRKNWSDGKTQTLESLFDAIVIGLDAYLVAEKARREDRDAWHRAYEENQRRWALAEQRAEREKGRLRFVHELCGFQAEADKLRAWLGHVELRDADGSPRFARVIAWTRERLAFVEQQSDADLVEAALSETSLFPDVDDLEDPLGEPD